MPIKEPLPELRLALIMQRVRNLARQYVDDSRLFQSATIDPARKQYYYGHSGLDPKSSENKTPARLARHWIPAFAGMTCYSIDADQ